MIFQVDDPLDKDQQIANILPAPSFFAQQPSQLAEVAELHPLVAAAQFRFPCRIEREVKGIIAFQQPGIVQLVQLQGVELIADGRSMLRRLKNSRRLACARRGQDGQRDGHLSIMPKNKRTIYIHSQSQVLSSRYLNLDMEQNPLLAAVL